MRILGLDISSSTIGYCILEVNKNDNSIKVIEINYFKPDKKGNIIERLASTRDKIKDIFEEFEPDHIAIEDIVQYMPHHSKANTIITLAVFNRMICLLSYDFLQEEPKLLSVLKIRHGLKLSKVLPKKEEMPALVEKHLGIKFPYEYKRNGCLKSESGDMADAVAVALYHAYSLTGRFNKKRKIKK